MLHLLTQFATAQGRVLDDQEAEGSVAHRAGAGRGRTRSLTERASVPLPAREALLKQLRSRHEQLRLQPPPLPVRHPTSPGNLRTLQPDRWACKPLEVESAALALPASSCTLHCKTLSSAISAALSACKTLHVLALALSVSLVELPCTDVLSPEGAAGTSRACWSWSLSQPSGASIQQAGSEGQFCGAAPPQRCGHHRCPGKMHLSSVRSTASRAAAAPTVAGAALSRTWSHQLQLLAGQSARRRRS